MVEIYSTTYTYLFNELVQTVKFMNRGQTPLSERNQKNNIQQLEKADNSSPNKGHEIRESLLHQPISFFDSDLVIFSEKGEIAIESLLLDYKKIMLITTQFDDWAGSWIGGAVLFLFLEFILYVFVSIQTLAIPGSGFGDVIFYCQDTSFGMVIMFRMLVLMSRMYPASTHFLREVKNHINNELPQRQRKHLTKYHRALKVVDVRLGSKVVMPETVPEAIYSLTNYYISAAMYKVDN